MRVLGNVSLSKCNFTSACIFFSVIALQFHGVLADQLVQDDCPNIQWRVDFYLRGNDKMLNQQVS